MFKKLLLSLLISTQAFASYNPNNPNGSATSANSSPVVIASDQGAIPTSGTLTCNAGTGTLAVSLATAPSTPVTGTFWQATQPVSGAVTANISGSISNTSFAATQATASSLNMTDATGVLVQGSKAAGTAATNSLLVGQVYSSSVPALTNGHHLVISPDLFFTGQSAQTALVNNIIPATAGANATDALGYHSATVQLVAPAGTYTTGAVIFEGSNDNTNFQTIPVYSQLILTGTPIVAAITLVTTTQLIYTFPIQTRYIRVRISTAISGASAQVQAFTKLSVAPWSPGITQVAQATGANLNATITTLPTLAAVTTVSTVTTLANGQTASGSAATGSPIRIGGTVLTTLPTTLATGNAANINMATSGALITKEFGTGENDWYGTSGSTPVTGTSATIKAAGAASIRNYVTSCQFYNTSATVSTTVLVEDGSTVMFAGYLPAATASLPVVPDQVEFHTPLRGTAATAVNLVLGTTGASVSWNCQGYQSF